MQLILLIASLLFLSCRHEESTYTKSFIHNNSSHSIKILPYHKGVVVEQDSVYIFSKQTSLVLDKNNRGKGTGFTYSLFLANYDSIRVTFDNSIQSIHYSGATSHSGSNLKGIKYDSSRSIYNDKNYIRKIIQEDKRNISNEYTFTFTEQDYVDAQKN